MTISRGTRRFAIWFCTVALVLAAIGVFARGALLSSVGNVLLRADPLVKSDAIVVLAGGTPQREIDAAELYAAGYAPRVVLTVERDAPAADLLRQRGIAFESPAELKRRIVRGLGVPESAITLLDETRATSTRMETDLVREWVAANPIRRLIVVTSPYHTRRAGLIFSRALRHNGVEVRVHPASHEPWEYDAWWTDREQLKKGLVEIQKLVFYYIAYWWD